MYAPEISKCYKSEFFIFFPRELVVKYLSAHHWAAPFFVFLALSGVLWQPFLPISHKPRNGNVFTLLLGADSRPSLISLRNTSHTSVSCPFSKVFQTFWIGCCFQPDLYLQWGQPPYNRTRSSSTQNRPKKHLLRTALKSHAFGAGTLRELLALLHSPPRHYVYWKLLWVAITWWTVIASACPSHQETLRVAQIVWEVLASTYFHSCVKNCWKGTT